MYRFIETNTVVANCHKVPQKQFSKELMSVEEIVESLENITRLVKSVNSNVKIIFTVSPVRHIKDGFVENSQSKAHLISAIHQFLNQETSTKSHQSFYFPSYEIMMDEFVIIVFMLRIWFIPTKRPSITFGKSSNRFGFLKDAYKTMDEVDAVQKGLLHKPFNPKF